MIACRSMLRRTLTGIRLGRAALVYGASAVVTSAGPASAATLTLAATGASSFDDNIYRVAKATRNNIADPADVSNTIGLFGSLVTVPTPIVLSMKGAMQRTFFLKNTQLDSTEYDITGEASYKAAHGQVILDATHARRATSFEDLRVGPRSIRTLQLAHIEGDRVLVSGFGLVGQSTFSINKNSNPSTSRADDRRLEITGGFGYISRTGNIVALEARRLTARGLRDRLLLLSGVPLLYRADFNEESVNLRLDWQQPELWSFSTRIGYAHHRDLSGIASNFRGLIGKSKIIWSPTPFITAKIRAERSFSPDQSPFTNGIKSTSYGATLELEPVARFHAAIAYDKRKRVFRYDLQAIDPRSAARVERLSTLNASGDYILASGLHTSLAVEHRWRDSNVPYAIYKGTSVTLSLSFPLTH